MLSKGKIIVNKVKKGFEYKIEFENKKGKTVSFVAAGYEFEPSLNGQDCEFEATETSPPTFNRITIDSKEYPKKSKKIERENVGGSSSSSHPDDSFNLQKTMLPDYIKNSGLGNIDNFYLKFFRAARFEDKKFLFFKQKDRRRDGNPGFMIKPDFSKIDFPKVCNSLKDSVKELFPTPSSAILKFEPDWRMIVGLGGGSVYETSMTLHHIYGFPYIPASAIKGVTRNWYIIEKFGKDANGRIDLQKAEMRALQDKRFCNIFGCPDKGSYKDEKGKTISFESAYKKACKGSVIFFDAYPLKAPELEVDIMNPHFGDYYTGKTPPGDYLKTNPIPFLTVVNTSFQFLIAYKPIGQINDEPDNSLLEDAKNALVEALKTGGIGAKTSLGYGILKMSS
jgi:CRISPR-associated protein Cmr6